MQYYKAYIPNYIGYLLSKFLTRILHEFFKKRAKPTKSQNPKNRKKPPKHKGFQTITQTHQNNKITPLLSATDKKTA